MPIPSFIDNYHLPPGEHECTFEEIESHFANSSDKRKKVWQDFKGILDRMRRLNITPSIILVDGSFVTGRVEPGDVDCACLILPGTVKRALKNADKHDKSAIAMITNPNFQGPLRDLFGAHPLIVDNHMGLSQWSTYFRKGGSDGLKEPDYTRDPNWVNKPVEKGILKIIL